MRLVLILLFFVSSAAFADQVIGQARVIDGDGLIVDGTEHRLFAIDAVESNQTCLDSSKKSWACGQEAARFLGELVNDADTTCHWTNEDQFDRKLSVCEANGVELNAELVLNGFAIAYTHYSDKYVDQEASARANKLGIWQGDFVQPYKFRQSGSKPAADSPYEDKKIKGNINKKGLRLYHCPSDKSYSNTKITEAQGEMWFATAGDAERAGWVRPPTFGACR